MTREKVFQKLLLLAIILLAAYFRMSGLSQQGLFLHDEAVMFQRAKVFADVCLGYRRLALESVSYVDSKIFWIFLVAVVQKIFDGSTGSVHFLSALFGVATVFLTYVFASHVFRNRLIGLLSALFLAVSSYHIFYSRIILAESAGGFFFLLSVLLYWIGLKRDYRYVILPAVFAGLAFLTDRYRVMLIPLIVLILEGAISCENKKSLWQSIGRLLVFYVLLVITVFSYQAFVNVLALFGKVLPSYINGFVLSLSKHNRAIIDLFSFLTYPYFLWRFDGPLPIIFVLAGLKFWRGEKAWRILFIFVVLQILASSLVDDKAARNISAILPFIAILAGHSVYGYLQLLNNKRIMRVVATVLVFLIAMLGWRNSQDVLKMRSAWPQAVVWLNQNSLAQKVVSLNPLANLYLLNAKMIFPHQGDSYKITSMLRNNDQFLLLDPQGAMALRIYRDYKKKTTLPGLVDQIEKSCEPQVEFGHMSAGLMQRFIGEHNRNFAITLDWFKTLNVERNRKIRIYDLKVCEEKIN